MSVLVQSARALAKHLGTKTLSWCPWQSLQVSIRSCIQYSYVADERRIPTLPSVVLSLWIQYTVSQVSVAIELTEKQHQ